MESGEWVNGLTRAVLYFFLVVTIGILGFVFFEHLSWLDAIYLTIATVATVGYGDVVPLTVEGKIFTILFVILGVGISYYTLTLIMTMMIEGRMKDHFGRRSMLHKISSLENHVIVCGAGRVGRHVIAGLQRNGETFVVIESEPSRVDLLLEEKVLTICGDAKLDKILQAAGVKTAKALVAALSNDADNVYVTLSAKSQNHNIMVIVRADAEEAEAKMRQAGATTVISPSVSGGRQMVAAVTHPLLLDFIQNVFYNQELHVDMTEVSVSERSKLAGKTLSEVLANTLELLIVAIKRDNTYISTTLKEEIMKPGDTLIVIGQTEAIQEMICFAKKDTI